MTEQKEYSGKILQWVKYVDEKPKENISVIVCGLISGELITIDSHYKNGEFNAELYQLNDSYFADVTIKPIYWLKPL